MQEVPPLRVKVCGYAKETNTSVSSRTMPKRADHIYHITEEHSHIHPGVTAVVNQLTWYLADQSWEATILTAGKADTPRSEGVAVKEFPLVPGGRLWRSPRGMRGYLDNLLKNPGQLFHIHAIWMAPQWLAARAASRVGAPAILTAHGQLEPWHWHDGRARRVKKLAYWYLVAYPAFRHIPVIHAITPKERDHLKNHFPKQRLEVIPNAIDLRETDSMLANQEIGPEEEGKPPFLLFLGRLHAKKGVDLLIKAFSRARPSRAFQLIIAGPNTHPAYTKKLKDQAYELGLEKQVVFLGPVHGARKYRLYRDAWAFCAPSFSEVVGMVNLEAAATGTPVITTHETGLVDWQEGGGILVYPQLDDLVQALKQVFSWSETERNDRGRQLRHLVQRRYSLEAVGPQWLKLYEELLEQYG